ncbi:hypothetical protein F4823DRAFT_632521 [Ustulina deusta]|nr:hypothetical protein F4823DRAFT_632521 [Ustulina deusta]
MSALIFCCPLTKPTKLGKLDHESKFTAFTHWAHRQTTSAIPGPDPSTSGAHTQFSSEPDPEQEVQEIVITERPYPSDPNSSNLKGILRFLLPKVEQKLGPSSLVSLLCLDRADAELGLDLDLESLWETELSISNLLVFFTDCLFVDGPATLSVDLADNGELILPAMHYVSTHEAQFPTGRGKLQHIVKTVLDQGHNLPWVTMYGDSILRMFTSGPSKELLEHCRRKDERLGQKQADGDNRSFGGGENEKIEKELWWPSDDDDRVDYSYDSSDHEGEKDYAACDRECGYCGHCDY